MKVISRQEALTLGLSRYFTGKPCKRGHIAERYVNRSYCVQCDILAKQNTHKEKPEIKLLQSARFRAKKEGWDFNLTKEDISIPTICPVLGILLVVKGKQVTDNSPSLDRIDNTKGYIKGNVAVISYRANSIKNDGSIEEHSKVIEYMKLHSLS